MEGAARVLIVEDDRSVREMTAEYLASRGYVVEKAASSEAMREAIAVRVPDLVLLDLNLPGEDGLSAACHLRERHGVGIIMVTGATDLADRVAGLEAGADDYVAKPFEPRELLARVKSVLRRTRRPIAAEARPAAESPRVRIGRYTLDVAAHRLLGPAGEDIALTPMEFSLLRAFTEHPNQVLDRDRLFRLTRGRDWSPLDRSVDIGVARLRRRIEPDPDRPALIRTVRGTGYRYVPAEVQ
ncbi:MAG TPA: response regulator [Burkholderiales bacterium]|nr:response regulator [Burkholderiales bacterium]